MLYPFDYYIGYRAISEHANEGYNTHYVNLFQDVLLMVYAHVMHASHTILYIQS